MASRRKAADLVRQGLVEVNGQVTDNVALDVQPEDEVRFQGKKLEAPDQFTTIILNKPAGVICSRSDPHNPDTVMDCLPANLRETLKPVGRLDKDTTGLLLLTDDGNLAQKLAHPRHGVEKTYRVRVRGNASDASLETLRKGVQLEDGPTAPAKIKRLRYIPDSRETELEIIIHEGRNRQVKRMCETVGHRVTGLSRVAYGPLRLGNLGRGMWRPLTRAELRSLS